MEIRYRANGMQRNVSDAIGQTLINRNLATAVYQTREIVPEEVSEPEELSTPAIKKKRAYKRRDIRAED